MQTDPVGRGAGPNKRLQRPLPAFGHLDPFRGPFCHGLQGILKPKIKAQEVDRRSSVQGYCGFWPKNCRTAVLLRYLEKKESNATSHFQLHVQKGLLTDTTSRKHWDTSSSQVFSRLFVRASSCL